MLFDLVFLLGVNNFRTQFSSQKFSIGYEAIWSEFHKTFHFEFHTLLRHLESEVSVLTGASVGQITGNKVFFVRRIWLN